MPPVSAAFRTTFSVPRERTREADGDGLLLNPGHVRELKNIGDGREGSLMNRQISELARRDLASNKMMDGSAMNVSKCNGLENVGCSITQR